MCENLSCITERYTGYLITSFLFLHLTRWANIRTHGKNHFTHKLILNGFGTNLNQTKESEEENAFDANIISVNQEAHF